MARPYQFVSRNLSIASLDSLSFPILDYGYLYGYGIFETILIKNNIPLLLDGHYERLHRAADILDIPFTHSLSDLRHGIQALMEKNDVQDGVLNLYLSPGDRPPGPLQLEFGDPVFLMILRPLLESERLPVNVALRQESFKRVPLDQFKTMSYMKNIYELKLAQPFDDVLLYSEDGHVLESPVANVFMVKGREIFTPESPLILPGIVRAFLLEFQDIFGFKILERPIRIEELPSFDELFLTNSLNGIIPVQSVETMTDLSSKAVTATCQEIYKQLVVEKSQEHVRL